jgi:hypothetical protein
MDPALTMERVERPSGDVRASIAAIFPDDALKAKRERNLGLASYVVVAREGSAVAGTVFVRAIAGIPNMTWIVSSAFQRRGIATGLVKRAQQDFRFLTAICRNDASKGVARKAGFLVLPMGFAFWKGKKA